MMKALYVLLVLLAFVVIVHGFTRLKDSHRGSIFKGPVIKDRLSKKHHDYNEDTGGPSTLPELSISSLHRPKTLTTERPKESTTIPLPSPQFRHRRSWDFREFDLPYHFPKRHSLYLGDMDYVYETLKRKFYQDQLSNALRLLYGDDSLTPPPTLPTITAKPKTERWRDGSRHTHNGDDCPTPPPTKPTTLSTTTTNPTTRPTTKPTSTTPVPTATKLPHDTTTIYCYQLLSERYPVLDNNFWDLFFNDNPILTLQAEREIIRFFSESSILSNQIPQKLSHFLTPTTTPIQPSTTTIPITQKNAKFPVKSVDFLSRIKRSFPYGDCIKYGNLIELDWDCITNLGEYEDKYGSPDFSDNHKPIDSLVSNLELIATTTSSTKTTTKTTSPPKPTTTKFHKVTTPVQPESFKSNRPLECYDLLGERYQFLADILWDMAVNASKYYYDEYYDESEISSSLSDTLIQSNQNTQIPTTTSFPKTPTATPTTKFTLHNTEAASVPPTTLRETSTIDTTLQPTAKSATTIRTSTTKQETAIKPVTIPATTLRTATTKPPTAIKPITTPAKKPTTTPTKSTTSTTTPTITSTITPTTISSLATTDECPEITTLNCYELVCDLYPILTNNLWDLFFNDSQIVRQQAEKEIIRLLNDSSIQINQIPAIKLPEDTDTFQQEWLLSCKVVDCYNLLIEGYPFLEDMLWGMVIELEKSHPGDSINFHL